MAAAPPAGGSQADPLIAEAPWPGVLVSLDTQETPAEALSSHGLQEPEISSSGLDTIFSPVVTAWSVMCSLFESLAGPGNPSNPLPSAPEDAQAALVEWHLGPVTEPQFSHLLNGNGSTRATRGCGEGN